MSIRGTFISLEGSEGCGKSTQSRRLKGRLEGLGLEVVCTREPGGTPTGEAIRDILQHDVTGEAISPEAEALLFAASRAQHVAHVIAPALARGAWVICDRYVDSSVAYQGVGRGLGLERVWDLNVFAMQGVLPDVTVWLNVSEACAVRRLAARNVEEATVADRMERAGDAFHRAVAGAFEVLEGMYPERIREVDADGSEDEVSENVWRVVVPFLGDVL